MMHDLRRSGIEILGDVPWGTHLCIFYQNLKDINDVLCNYFREGLENNEYCLWIVSEESDIKGAFQVLREKINKFDDFINKGQMEIVTYSQWYLIDGVFNQEKTIQRWITHGQIAKNKGFDGFRFTGNAKWDNKEDWINLSNYEKAVDNVILNHDMIALCSYPLDKCNATEIIEVINNHKYALIKEQEKWVYIESSEAQIKDISRFPELNPSPVMRIDKQGRIVYSNYASNKILEAWQTTEGDTAPDWLKNEIENVTKERKVKYKEITINKDFYLVCIAPFVDKGYVHLYFMDITERKLAEEKIIETTRFYDEILSGLISGIWVTNKDDVIIYVNKGMSAISGLSRQETLNVNVLTGFSEGTLKMFRTYYLKAKETLKPIFYEGILVKTPAGRDSYQTGWIIPRIRNGKYDGIICTVEDVTQAKIAEDKLVELRKLYQLLFDTTTSGVAVYTAVNNGEDFIFKDMNKSGEMLSHVKRDEIIGKSVLEIMPGIKKMGLFEVFQQVWRTGIAKHHPVSIYQDQKCLQWFENYVYKLPTGEIVAVYDEKTEEKRAAEERSFIERRYQDLVNNINIGIYRSTTDSSKGCLEANKTLVKMFGYDDIEDFKKAPVSEHYSPATERDHLVEQLKKDGEVREKIIRFVKKDKSFFWGAITARAHYNQDNEFDWIDGAIEDITERKKAEDKLQARNKELEEFMRITRDREIKMIELKQEINELYRQKGQEPKYPV